MVDLDPQGHWLGMFGHLGEKYVNPKKSSWLELFPIFLSNTIMESNGCFFDSKQNIIMAKKKER